MNVQTVIFDLDGTLLDTIGDLAAAGNRVCLARGWSTHTREEFKAMVGHGIPNLVHRFARTGSTEAEIASALAAFLETYGCHCTEETAPYPGIPELLERLRRGGLKLAVLSNKADGLTGRIINAYFHNTFQVVRGLLPGTPPKPDPAGVRAVLAALGTNRALLVGDSGVDVETARNAGLPVCGVTWGFRGREALSGADWVADTAAALEDVILTARQ